MSKEESNLKRNPSILQRLKKSFRRSRRPAQTSSAPGSQLNIDRTDNAIYQDTEPIPYDESIAYSSSLPVPKPPIRRRKKSFALDDDYDMAHKSRGLVHIFNQRTFSGQAERFGTDCDVESLREQLLTLGFTKNEIILHENLKITEIMNVMNELSQQNHKDRDCVMVIVLSHGCSQEMVFASDGPYKIQKLWKKLQPQYCSSLAGKPKIFIFQACRGKDVETGAPLKVVMTDSVVFEEENYRIPNTSDFLMCYSCQPGYVSLREEDGSWFIQTLCDEINKMDLAEDEFTHVLTRVNRKVALNRIGVDQRTIHKQCPSYTSTLLKRLYFRPKYFLNY